MIGVIKLKENKERGWYKTFFIILDLDRVWKNKEYKSNK